MACHLFALSQTIYLLLCAYSAYRLAFLARLLIHRFHFELLIFNREFFIFAGK
jgi:hypothetical protein